MALFADKVADVRPNAEKYHRAHYEAGTLRGECSIIGQLALVSQQLIVLGNYNGIDIMARPDDNFVDVTQLCQTHGKEWSAYAKNEAAKRFRTALSASLRIPQAGDDDGLVVPTRNPDGRQGHTFADRRIALHCASWISPEFEVWCYGKIEELVTKGHIGTND